MERGRLRALAESERDLLPVTQGHTIVVLLHRGDIARWLASPVGRASASMTIDTRLVPSTRKPSGNFAAQKLLGEVVFTPTGRDVRYAAEQQDQGTACRARVELRNSGTAL